MKTFFDGIFLDRSKLEEEGIKYPIKLEYYKTIAESENVEAKYGIEVVKTEYKSEFVNVESNKLENLTNSSKEIEKILAILRDNEVTPIAMQDVLDDMSIEV